MTIPMIVMIVSAVLWFALTMVKEPQLALTKWLIDPCRIVFAVSTLVVIWSVMNTRVFD
jgi:nitric oxide reductase large subunit